MRFLKTTPATLRSAPGTGFGSRRSAVAFSSSTAFISSISSTCGLGRAESWSRRRRASSANAGRSGSSNGCRHASRSICSQTTLTWTPRPLARAARGGRRGARYKGAERDILARHKSFPADGRFRIRGGTGMTKQELYGRVVRALLADQIRSVDDPQHRRLVSEENGLTSLEVAVEADELARKATAQPNATRS